MMHLLPAHSCIAPEAPLNDPITRLYNRQGLILAGAHLLQGTSASQRWAFLLTLEINHWWVVNQALGNEASDILLIQTAASLRGLFRWSAVIGRLGLARFAVLARVASPAAGTALMARFADQKEGLGPSFDGIPLPLRGGFTQFDPQYSVSIPRLLQAADARMNAFAAASVPAQP
jgi:diguanylate cyclase (GGDEF)-like protein